MRRRLLTVIAGASVAAAVLTAVLLRPDDAPVQVQPQVSTAVEGPQLLFDDEFNGTALDASVWHTCFWWAPTTCTIESHDEMGLYTARNVSVADGILTLQARREAAVGWNGKTYDYTSGLVSTGGSAYSTPKQKPGFTFTYGYVEARIQVPAGQGLVPAFWLQMADHSWPPEIDVMELLGGDPTRTTWHYHYRRRNGAPATVGDGWQGPDFSAGWHTFGLDWEPGSLTWYVDGAKKASFVDATVTDQPAYLVLNMEVGGTWGGPPDATTTFPADLAVDYVRVYQHRTAE